MSDDLEQRLRDSLRAYAELVDAPAGELPTPSAAAHRRTPVRRWRGAVLAAAAAAAVVTGSVWFAAGDRSDPVDATATGSEQADAAAEPPVDDTRAAAEAGTGAAEVPEPPAAPEVGVAYPVGLYTHCGVYGLDIAGVWFAADPPLVDGAGNPPAGWGNPYQLGTVTLTSAEEAVFADDTGHVVALRAADESARPAPCD